MPHRLDPLLRPRSIAVVGATVKRDSVGSRVIQNLQQGEYGGRLYAVNPGYADVHGTPCYPSLADLPDHAEHVIFAVGDRRIEAALDDAIIHGIKAATIISTLVLADDPEPPLKERIGAKVYGAGILVCGGNAMGFYNFHDGIWACGFDTRKHSRGGNVALISHSGSGMSGIVDVDERIRFNLAVSTGQELVVSMDEYLDFALELPDTRVVGLFMETARNPDGLIAAFEKANAKGIPIVAIKVGKTELSARLTVSHCGAIAGIDSSFDALFDRYGVQRVDDMDELATTLIMFAQPHPVGPGALVSIHDSGGERQLTIDLGDEIGVSFAELAPETVARLEEMLDPGLPAVNPLDAWSVGGPDSDDIMEGCMATMMADPAAAIGAVIHDRAPFSGIYPRYADYLRKGHAASGKPVFLVANRQGTGSDATVLSLTEEGFPVLDGISSFLTGARCLFAYRDFRFRPAMAPPELPPDVPGKWQIRLAGLAEVDEIEAAELLDDFGLPVNPCRVVENEKQAVAAATAIGFPVVLKTGERGIAHKTDVGGVLLALPTEAAVAEAYQNLAARIGPRALVASMVTEPGTEMILGLVNDEQFGPVVVLGIGGIHAETARDVKFALPPFDTATAWRLVDALKMRALLDGARGLPAVDVGAYCEAAARFSVLAATLGDWIQEIDINPIIISKRGCIAVDSLIVLQRARATAAKRKAV